MKLTEAQRSTLREMKSHNQRGNQYVFRQATCRKLEALGLAVATRKDVKRPPYHITEAGREASAALTSLREERDRLVKENAKLKADLAFADEHASKIEALLEPHIKWSEPDAGKGDGW